MAINISDPDTTEIAQARALVEQLVLENHPSLDTRGVIGDLVLGNYALLGAGYSKDAERLLASRSLKALEDNPEAATDEVVDAILSNFNLTRLPAAASEGVVEMLLSDRLAITIHAGAIFTIRGTQYMTTATYTARLSPQNNVTLTDLPLIELSGGRYAVRFPVTAVVPGRGDAVRRGDAVIPTTYTPQGFLLARAFTDFSSGRDIETNESLIRRLRLGMSLKSWSTPTTIEALLTSEVESLGDIQGVSVIGLGDAELLRTKHPLTGITSSGCDVYVRTADLPRTTLIRKTAAKIENSGTGSLQSLTLSSSDAPGFYEVLSVREAGGEDALPIQSMLLGVDESSPTAPEFQNSVDAAYGSYSTLTILVSDPNTVADAPEYDIEVTALPAIKDIQDFLNDPGRRPLGGDVHVRAAIPCFVSVELHIELEHQGVMVDEDAVRSAAVAVINREAFPGRIYRSHIESAVSTVLQDGSSVRASVLRGRFRKPNGDIRTRTASEVLVVPYEVEDYVSSRTVAFFAHADDVSIQISLAD